ncbi:MAG: hypothetical protein L6R42_005282 [Xanthoria sp. 1 TBL-2021]|nr:MAG: hypothetical protein L6R42_005282 [Xanthoria sp. 1 TBL-2021]
MPFFSRFRNKDPAGSTSRSKQRSQFNGGAPPPPPKPRWADAWLRKDVEPEEVQELLRGCTNELKSKALDLPFLLLPFRPASDPSAARTFIRNFFNEERGPLHDERLEQELLLTEPMVLCSVMKWCWSRLAGGVVTWEAYELFRVGEQDSDMARDAFATFIPISVESDARTKIIFDFFDLMAAIAAHGKSNGMGGRNLSRLAGWWAFEQFDNGKGFDGGYKSWASAADATCHLFFAYLRSLSPNSVRGVNGISALPISLQTLAEATEYPPQHTSLNATSKVVMIVDRVSPTPFALLRRAKHFEYRDDDEALQEFSNYEDPVQALTEECRRVLKCISSTNQSAAATSKTSTSLRNPDAEWSRFEDLGFGSFANEFEDDLRSSELNRSRRVQNGLTSAPRSQANDVGRPTTPSWADFLSSGFNEDSLGSGPTTLRLPPDKMLPPLDGSGTMNPNSQKPHPDAEERLEPAELASIKTIYFDEVFWWVWISSLAGEESPDRKAVFGRCALLETNIRGGKWLVLEEMVKGAAPEPEMGYIAEKKSRNPFSKRSRLGRTKSTKKLPPPPPPPKTEPYLGGGQGSPLSKNSISNDQHARIQAAAAVLQRKQKDQTISPRRARADDATSKKTNSVFTLQPVLMSEAGPAMKWANTYDKNAIRAKYLGDEFAGRGSATDLSSGINGTNGSITPVGKREQLPKSESYGFPSQADSKDRALPALPPQSPAVGIEQAAPIPLPMTPTKEPSNRATTEAAEVPLPATTPGESRAINRKPLPRVESAAQVPLPATTPMETDKALPPTDRSADEPAALDDEGSLGSLKKDGKKLKRKETGGLRSLFGRNKSGVALPASAQPTDSAAVAAARAALSGSSPKANYVAPDAPSSLSRRFSGIGRKKSPAVPPIASPSVPAIQDEDRPPSPPPYQPQPRMADRYDPKSRAINAQDPSGRYDSQVSISRGSSDVQRDADCEFDRFDQGPVEQPAFVPADSPAPSTRASTRTATPTEQRMSSRVSSESEEERPPSPAQDRWAQIRKNAAERAAAAQQNEEQAGRVSGAERTDDGDGETSGEETIESRVARIKARVAELTGNMQQAGGRP